MYCAQISRIDEQQLVRIGRLASYEAEHPFECLHIGVEFPLLAG